MEPLAPAETKKDRTLDLMLVLKEHFDPKQICSVLNELMGLVEDGPSLECMEDYHVHQLILDLMMQFKTNPDVQEVGCNAIWKLFHHSSRQRKRIDKAEAYKLVMEAMERHKQVEAVQAAGLRCAAYLAISRTTRAAMLENDIMDQVIIAMTAFKENRSVQANACQALTHLLFDDERHLADLVSSKGYKLIVEAANQHADSPAVMEQVLWALRVLVTPEVNRRELVREKLYRYATSAMGRFTQEGEVQAAACGVIEMLSTDETCQKQMVDDHVPDLVFKGMQDFPKNAFMQTFALSTLAYLGDSLNASDDEDAFENRPETRQNLTWLENIFHALTNHASDPAVQEAGCRSLCKLLEHHPDLIRHIGEEDKEMPIHSAVLAAIMMHGEDQYVFKVACEAIYHLTADWEPLQTLLMNKGAYLSIINYMGHHATIPGAQQFGCRALRGLTLLNDDHKQKLAEVSALSLVVSALKRFRDNVGVQEEAIGVIATMSDVAIVRHQCIIEKVHTIVLDSMNKFLLSRDVQDLGLEALGVLSLAEGVPAMLNEAGALHTTIHAMEKNPEDDSIQYKGLIMLQVLVEEERFSSQQVCEEVAKLVVEAMTRFKDITRVQEEGCVAIQLLAEMSPEMSQVLVNNDAQECLFHILECYSYNQGLLDVASECLYVLSCELDLKAQMLLSACSKGSIRGVECLIQLGADVNTGEGHNTPLCLACERGDEHLVHFLLKQGISDLQPALQLSLKKEHHTIIGLLLKHMGHDREAGVVSWSGLSLGGLRAEWLQPMLVDRKTNNNMFGTGVAMAAMVKQIRNRRETRPLPLTRNHFGGSDPSLAKMSFQLDDSMDRRYPFSCSVPRPDDTNQVSSNDEAKASIASDSSFDGYEVTDVRRKSVAVLRSPSQDSLLDDTIDANRSNNWWNRMLYPILSVFSELTGLGDSRRPSLESGLELSPPKPRRKMRRKYSKTGSEMPFNRWDPRNMTEQKFGQALATIPQERDRSRMTPESPGFSPSRLTPPYTSTPVRATSPNIPPRERTWDWLRQVSISEAEETDSTLEEPQSPLPQQDSMDQSRSPSLAVPPQPHAALPHKDNMDQSSPDRVKKLSLMKNEEEENSHPIRKRAFTSVDKKPGRSLSTSAVRLLDISSNGIVSLDGLIKSDTNVLNSLVAVEKLDLSQNSLKDFPWRLCQALPKLQSLDLHGNSFTTFPAHVLACQHLDFLDLSNNKIADLTKKPSKTSFSLKEFNISHNSLTALPSWIGVCMPMLQVLNVEGNRIAKIVEEEAFQLRRLKMVNISKNQLKELPVKFFLGCPKLETLVASCNELDNLPYDAAIKLPNLSTVKLAHNKLAEPEPTYIPRFLLLLDRLRSLDLSNNELQGLPPPSHWNTHALRELMLGGNQIRKLVLGDSAKQWATLERLIISHNKLQEVPRELGYLTSLTSLDFSHNRGINTLPDELGRLSKLWELPLDGLRLDLDPAIVKGRTKDVIGFLSQRLKQAVPHYRMKLMVVGFGGRGKSTLLRQLQKIKADPRFNTATIGVLVKDWKIPVKKSRSKTHTYTLSTWDFAGQEEFYSTHQCFLSSRSLYLVVYDLSRGPKEVESLRPWLLNIQARAPNCPVIVVGTHKDRIKREEADSVILEMRHRVQTLCTTPGFPEIKGYAEVSCIKESPAMEDLRKQIINVIDNFKVKGQPVMGQMIPHSYMQLEDLVTEEAQSLRAGLPVIRHSRLLELVKEANLQLDEEELSQAVRFLHESGVLLHYDDPALQLKDLYFIDPEWLCQMMAQVVTVREGNPFVNNKGILKKSDVTNLFKGGAFPPELIPQYLRLLEKFEIALPQTEEELLIPCRLPFVQPPIDKTAWFTGHVYRQYVMPYIPIGFWSRLITRLMVFSMYVKTGPTTPLQKEYWREGIYVFWTTQEYFLVKSIKGEKNSMDITVPATRQGSRLLGHVVDHVDDLIEEWFPGLCEIDPVSGQTLVVRQVPCVLCETEAPHIFLLTDILAMSDRDDIIFCPNHDMPVPLHKLAPDVMLSDLDSRYQLQEDKFKLEQIPENELGDGSFGNVYRASYKNMDVAVKVFSKVGEDHPHRMLRQEVTILTRLQHISVISLLAVGLRPRLLVLELAPMGSLTSHLCKKMSRGLQQRIAMQIAEGLKFLHTNMIIYRDLKPDNILIFSIAQNSPVNAKISDYGISKFATLLGLTAPEGTPGYRAPEVARGDTAYNNKVDLFSFGILLFELVTGRKPFEDLHFRGELDEAIIKGRPLDPITSCGSAPWPDVQDLITHCMQPIPDDRPTATEVFSRLSRGELLCLRRSVPLGKGLSPECIAIRNFREKDEERVEVWIGSGDGSSAQLAWFSLTENQPCKGVMLDDRRILCMTAIGQGTMLVGTQSGRLWVYDAVTHTKKYVLSPLRDAILCMEYNRGFIQGAAAKWLGSDAVFVGLANGTVAVFPRHTLEDEKARPTYEITVGNGDDPVTCMTLNGKQLWLGCSKNIVTVSLEKLTVERSWKTNKGHSVDAMVMHIAHHGKLLYLGKRNSSVVEVWEESRERLRDTIDVHPMVKKRHPDVSFFDTRVKSFMLQASLSLWIGTGGGHLVLVDAQTHSPLAVIHRHLSAVRAVTIARKQQTKHGFKPLPSVLTVGMGFVKRPGHRVYKSDAEYGHVLLWDGDLPRQIKYMKADAKKRAELMAEKTSQMLKSHSF
ncbi:PREDICTED: leucine-rich repeat serine/threonine-protein kinase 2-like [Branchiostoma belcheri]|uniref:non-specific serine/threonine protein kinase n=1 Tax=Branchiostoma belcheri TaxID=7741 RepID=A0A6P4YW92_BRABE|nr:PREDICTED: leucine-rich repeat serine/threonine-protein kinase 2-like [Branchiostoma belcheri]